MYTRKLLPQTVLPVFTEVSSSHALVLSFTEDYISVFMIQSSQCCQATLKDSLFANFLLGWGVTVGSGLASYPIDTIRRRMMMTSGEGEKFSGSIDCFNKILGQGRMEIFLQGSWCQHFERCCRSRCLGLYDKLQVLVFGRKFGGG
jgi:solute carrier family 25 (adenine nucleotide translocator) protein 4/5/6/31